MNYYEVLGLAAEDLNFINFHEGIWKEAYRRALLRYHPDKSYTKQNEALERRPSVDDVTLAYQVLSNRSRRKEYDKRLKMLVLKGERHDLKDHIGIETVDLEDMSHDETKVVWFRGCRCGNPHGFQVTEEDLEREVDSGEIIVGCDGCSLWLRIIFQRAEES